MADQVRDVRSILRKSDKNREELGIADGILQEPIGAQSLDAFHAQSGPVATGAAAATAGVEAAGMERIESAFDGIASGRSEQAGTQEPGQDVAERGNSALRDAAGIRNDLGNMNGPDKDGPSGDGDSPFDTSDANPLANRLRDAVLSETTNTDYATARADSGGSGTNATPREPTGEDPFGFGRGQQQHSGGDLAGATTDLGSMDSGLLGERLAEIRTGGEAGLFTGIVNDVANSAAGSPSVKDGDLTEVDGNPVGSTEMDPVIDGDPIPDPDGNLPQGVPGLTPVGHGMVVFGGGAEDIDPADIPGIVAGAAARIIGGPIGQGIGAFGVGWRAGRAVDETTGIGEAAVNAALARTAAAKYEAEQEALAAAAQKRREEEEAKKAQEEENKTDSPKDQQHGGDYGGRPTPAEMAFRNYLYETTGYDSVSKLDTQVNPGAGGDATGAGGTELGAALGGMKSTDLVGQPGIEQSFGRGAGTLEGTLLPGAIGNIDYGEDYTGQWTEEQRTDEPSDALDSLGGSGLSIGDLRREEDEEDSSDDVNA